ncbi:unnamed protein product, partial [Amoebophrya sp. A120]
TIGSDESRGDGRVDKLIRSELSRADSLLHHFADKKHHSVGRRDRSRKTKAAGGTRTSSRLQQRRQNTRNKSSEGNYITVLEGHFKGTGAPSAVTHASGDDQQASGGAENGSGTSSSFVERSATSSRSRSRSISSLAARSAAAATTSSSDADEQQAPVVQETPPDPPKGGFALQIHLASNSPDEVLQRANMLQNVSYVDVKNLDETISKVLQATGKAAVVEDIVERYMRKHILQEQKDKGLKTMNNDSLKITLLPVFTTTNLQESSSSGSSNNTDAAASAGATNFSSSSSFVEIVNNGRKARLKQETRIRRSDRRKETSNRKRKRGGETSKKSRPTASSSSPSSGADDSSTKATKVVEDHARAAALLQTEKDDGNNTSATGDAEDAAAADEDVGEAVESNTEDDAGGATESSSDSSSNTVFDTLAGKGDSFDYDYEDIEITYKLGQSFLHNRTWCDALAVWSDGPGYHWKAGVRYLLGFQIFWLILTLLYINRHKFTGELREHPKWEEIRELEALRKEELERKREEAERIAQIKAAQEAVEAQEGEGAGGFEAKAAPEPPNSARSDRGGAPAFGGGSSAFQGGSKAG